MTAWQRIATSALLLIALVASAPAQPVAVLNVGDSITQGSREAGTYSALLAAELGDGFQVVNAGKSGATFTRTNRRDYRKTEQYRTALATPARIVTIMLGTNDSKINADNPDQDVWPAARATFAEDARDLIRTFKNLPTSPTVYLCLPPPAAEVNPFSIRPDVLLDEIIPTLLRVAQDEQINVIDMWHGDLLAETVDPATSLTRSAANAQFFTDGVHPSAEGNAVIARKLVQLIRRPYPTIRVGERTTLTCIVPEATLESFPVREYQWFRNGRPVEAGGNRDFLTASEPGRYAVAIRHRDNTTYDRLISLPYTVP
jgi:alpha-L-fucosidase 2